MTVIKRAKNMLKFLKKQFIIFQYALKSLQVHVYKQILNLTHHE